jgi:dTMP kinase
VVFEGPSGGGKSSQLQPTADFLTSLTGKPTHVFRDPDSTPGWSVASLALKLARTAPREMGLYDNMELAMLYAINRRELWSQIKRCLESNENVVCDRWIQSSQAYQGTSLDDDVTIRLIHIDLGIPLWADLTLYFPCTYTMFQARTAGREFREVDTLNAEEYQKIIKRYQDLRWPHLFTTPGKHSCPLVPMGTVEDTTIEVQSVLTEWVKGITQKVTVA